MSAAFVNQNLIFTGKNYYFISPLKAPLEDMRLY